MKKKKRNILPIVRFWGKIRICEEKGCWLWTSAKQSRGYGQFWNGEKHVYAHRFSYELHKGKIPDGLELDHLCRIRHCVNPDHLEAVTHQENVRRGERLGTINIRRTHCKRGHRYTKKSTRMYEYKKDRWTQVCRVCARERYHLKK